MKWELSYATGDPEVDRQHQELFRFSDEFRDVLDNGFGHKTYDLFLEFLAHYAEVHFSYEDRCMMAHRCPIADRNRKEHASFASLVREEVAENESHGFERQRAYTLLDKIDEWLVSHIGQIDVQLKACIG